jgi:predicted small secreted protein
MLNEFISNNYQIINNYKKPDFQELIDKSMSLCEKFDKSDFKQILVSEIKPVLENIEKNKDTRYIKALKQCNKVLEQYLNVENTTFQNSLKVSYYNKFLKELKSIKLDAEKPLVVEVYELVNEIEPLPFAVYIDANTGKVVQLIKRDSD